MALLSLVGAAAAAPAQPSLAAPRHTSIEFPFDLAARAGDADSFNFKIASPGCILAQIRPWAAGKKDEPKAGRLNLSLTGSDRATPRQQLTSPTSAAAPLWISYAVFPQEATKVLTWTVTVSNPDNRGSARGIVQVEYPPTQMPCALTARANPQGGIDLSWLHSGRPFSGSFLAERSTDNGSTWQPVSSCSLQVSNTTKYSCRDDAGVIGPQLLYRACAATSGTSCSGSNVTPAVRPSSR